MDPLLTGAHGTVGTAVTSHSTHEFVLSDRRPPPDTLADGTAHPHAARESVRLDLGNPDAASSLAAVLRDRDIDAVVHLAGDPALSATYSSVERNNVRATRNVLEAAAEAGVDTVVFASSIHAVGTYEDEHAPELYDPDYDLTVDADSTLRPDSDYGASKAAGEAWCRRYAEHEGIDCYALRIASVRDPTYDHPFGDAERASARGECERGDDAYREAVARLRCTWLSRRDCASLVDACLADGRNDVVGNGRQANPDTLAGGAFEVFYGTSDNSNSWFDIEYARDRIGYDPVDSADEFPERPG